LAAILRDDTRQGRSDNVKRKPAVGESAYGYCYMLWTVLLFGPCGFADGAEVIQGRVVTVADGDTITLLDGNQQQHRIRLAGIDAPEKAQAGRSAARNGQCPVLRYGLQLRLTSERERQTYSRIRKPQ